MKLCIVAIINLIILTQDINAGGLLDGVVNFGRGVAKKTHEDIDRVFHGNRNKQKDPVAGWVTEASDEDKFIFGSGTTPVPTKNVKTDDSLKPKQENDKVVPMTEAPVKPKQENAAPVTDKPVTTPDDKEGKEIFRGGCASGYQKTTDGRCEPTF